MGDDRLFNGINNDLESILSDVYAAYKDKLEGDDIRFFASILPDELEWRMPTLWPNRYLGHLLPPAHKVNGVHFSLAKSRNHLSHRWDGIWDFSDMGALVVRVTDLYSANGEFIPLLTFTLADSKTDLRKLARYFESLAKRYQIKSRSIVTIGSRTPSMGTKVSPDEVFLRPGIRESLIADAHNFITGRRWYRENALPWKRSVLLYGVPGTGKTTLAKLLASTFLDARKQVFALTVDRKTDSGDIHHAFSLASSAKPSMLILEDIDAVQQSEVGRSAFLNVLDGVGNLREGVYLVGSTNYPEVLDPAIVNRPGRWDRVIEVGLPTQEARRAYISRYWASTPHARLIPAVVAETEGMTLASVNELRYQVLMLVRDGKVASEAAVRRIARELRTIGKMTESGKWDSARQERVVGFAPSASPRGDDATPLNGKSRGDD